MRRHRNKIIGALVVLFVGMQLYRPMKNHGKVAGENFIGNMVTMPNDVQQVMEKACYDCHSNHTNYPWYSNLQPGGWWLENHVNDGKKHLNFSEFAAYPPKKQAHKLEEMIEMIEKGEMPLDSYTWVHKEAVLSKQEKTALINWAQQTKDLIAHNADVVKN